MAAEHVFHNGSGTSVVFDAAGHSVDADERIVGNPANPHIKRLVEAGQLTDLGASEDVAAVEEIAVEQADTTDDEKD